MKRIFLFLLGLGALFSCSKMGPEITSAEPSPDGSYPMEISCEPVAGEQESTKSSFTTAALTKVSNVCIFIYRDGSLVSDLYFPTASGISVSFPSSTDTYDVYMLANMGDVIAPQDEDDVADIKYSFMDYGQFNSKGFPMASSFLDFTPGSQTQFKLKRLIGMYSLSMENSSDVVDYEIKSLQLRNCACDIYPYKSQRATSFISEGDVLSASDIQTLNNGGSVNIYFLENLQGELLPGNTDPKQKIPDNIHDATLAAHCTYIQMLADVTTPTAHYDNVYYRVYLGQNMTTDFSIVRSTLYNLSLNFAKNMIADEGWRIEPEDPQVIGAIKLNKSEATVIKGIDDVIFVTTQSANGYAVDFDVTLNTSEASAAKLSYTKYATTYHGKSATAIKFTTTLPVDGLNSYNVHPNNDVKKVNVTITSKDTYNGEPTIVKNVLVNVYHQAFPIYLKAKKEGEYYYLYAYSNNPLKLPFRFDYKTYSGQDHSTVVKSDWNRYQRYSVEDNMFDEDADWSMYDNTLSRSGSKIGSLGRLDQYSGGIRLDLTVTPVSDSNFGTPYSNTCFLEYPKFSSGVTMYTGTGTKAYYGPGADMYPAAFDDYASDFGAFNFSYNGVPSVDSYSSFNTSFFANSTHFIMNSSTTGWNRQNSYTVSYFGNGAPFYFVNAGLNPYDRVAFMDDARYLDDSGRVGMEVYAYEPGRDLGMVTPSFAKFGFKIGNMTQFFGNVHTWQDWQNYDYNIYMTINGCSSWPGASSAASGFSAGLFVDEPIEF